jgi:hypothetical protein
MPTFDIIAVAEARAVGSARVWVRFGDRVEGTLDLSDEVRAGPFPELRKPEYFARVTVVGGGLAWPNGWDCAPEWLYSRVATANRTRSAWIDDDWDPLRRHARGVPEISRFFGIVIRMFYSDRARTHFHAEHGEHVISVEIDGDGVSGNFPPARLPMLFEWRDQHRAELMANWERLRMGELARPIAPLG